MEKLQQENEWTNWMQEQQEEYNRKHVEAAKEDFIEWLELHNANEDDDMIICNNLYITKKCLLDNIDEGEVVKLEESDITYNSVADEFNITDCFNKYYNVQLM